MISFDRASFSFGSQHVIEAISFECRRGEIVGIVGPSGAGKTTLLNLGAGYLQCSCGSVSVDGKEPLAAIRDQRIGYVFQSPTLLPWLTVEQNTALPLMLSTRRKISDADQKHVSKTLARVRLSHAADKYPHELSGGMKARAALARAIVYRAPLIFLDEPFSGLDDILKEESIYPDLQQLLEEENSAAILVTHDLNQAILLCDRVHVLKPESESGPSRLMCTEHVPFPRPRTTDLFEYTEFHTIRRRIRESLK